MAAVVGSIPTLSLLAFPPFCWRQENGRKEEVMKIEINKNYITRNGRAVKIIAYRPELMDQGLSYRGDNGQVYCEDGTQSSCWDSPWDIVKEKIDHV